MTKYHQFVDGYDRLKEDTKIRLAGREGVISEVDDNDNGNSADDAECTFEVQWSDGDEDSYVKLRAFVALEVEDKPIVMPFPLKAEIVKAVKAKTKDDFIAWIDAFPEKDSDVKV